MTGPYRISLVAPGVTCYPIGAIADGEILGRVGEELVGVSAPPPGAHAANHENGGSDEVALDASQIATGVMAMARLATGTPDGTRFIRDDGTLQVPGGGGAHATSHQDGGADEINVAGLTGLLATAQTPAAHTHTGVYEPANANIQAHVVSAHAPANAQANADITKAEIEAKLIGVIGSHSHAGSGSDPAFAPGSFTVLTGTFRIFAQELVLTTTEEATIEGTGLLEIS